MRILGAIKKIHSLSRSHQQNNFHKNFIAYFINIIHKLIHVEFINGNYKTYRCAPFSQTVPVMAAVVPSTTKNMYFQFISSTCDLQVSVTVAV